MAETRTSLKIRPQKGPQTTFLKCDADIVVYGGAAGGGKTYALLLDAARHTDVPGYNFVIFRREATQINNPGGLWDTSGDIYPHLSAAGHRSTLSWHWENGVRGTFAAMQHESDKLGWQGSQIAYIGFDELTHFTESQFFYMLSRNRSTCGFKPCVRATTNPGPSWVKGFLAPWLDPEHPYHAESGEVRWLARISNQIHWVHEGWRDPEGTPAKSVTFIKSTVYDNHKLLEKDPDYVANLKALPDTERKRLLDGDWDVFEGAFFSEWSEFVHAKIPYQVPAWYKFFGGLDYGQAAPFCFLLCASDDAGRVIVMDEVYYRYLQPSEQADLVAEVLYRNNIPASQCLIWADPSIFPPESPEQRRGHPGKYIAEEYMGRGLHLVRADNNRLNGWARVREYLHSDGALTVFKGRCPNLIRTIGQLPHDPGNAEDLDTNAEDHAADALRYALMSRPRQAANPNPPLIVPDYRPWWMKEERVYW